MSIRLAILNDYEVVVRGLAMMLAPYDAVEVVELDSQVPVEQPVDIALYDTFAQTEGPGQDVSELVANPLVCRVVVYTWNMDALLIKRTLERGVAGYLAKSLPADELVAALQSVHAGQCVVSPASAPDELPVTSGDWPGREHGLTAREAEVIALITQGLSNAEIATKASLSINSVKSYIRTSYRKMGVTSRTNAVLWGLNNGFAPSHLRIRPQKDAS